jgi:hypothetical protein
MRDYEEPTKQIPSLLHWVQRPPGKNKVKVSVWGEGGAALHRLVSVAPLWRRPGLALALRQYNEEL